MPTYVVKCIFYSVEMKAQEVISNKNNLFAVAPKPHQLLSCYLPQEYAKLACSKTHPCGHPCGGVKNEETCLPCLHGCDKNTGCLKQDADDMCMICFTEALSAAPAVQVSLHVTV